MSPDRYRRGADGSAQIERSSFTGASSGAVPSARSDCEAAPQTHVLARLSRATTALRNALHQAKLHLKEFVP
jgi:hypothetical protein